MRLIDADALMFHLADYELQESPYWGANGHGNETAYLTIKECEKAVEEQPTIDAVSVEWIPCEERLPSEYGNYLITMGDGAVDVRTYGTPPIDGWSACDANGFYWLEDEEVLAWMPLPKPYRERSDT